MEKNPACPLDIQSEFKDLNGTEINLTKQRIPPHPSSKDRYRNILPVTNTAVLLNKVEGRSANSSYINANYVSDKTLINKQIYICCQAPVIASLEDFWRMIWEQESTLIVMLTNLFESGIEKATKYWPIEVGKTTQFGQFCIKLIEEKQCDNKNITIRSLQLNKIIKNELNSESRTIQQLHITNWRDHEITDPNDIICLLNEIDKRNKSLDIPIVIHCSAGVGRTGVLVAIAHCFSRHKQSMDYKIKDIVQDIRTQRYKRMVQTEKQYEFIYSVMEVLTRHNNQSLTNTDEVQIKKKIEIEKEQFTIKKRTSHESSPEESSKKKQKTKS